MDPWMMDPQLIELLSQAGVLDEKQAINLHNLKQAEQQAATPQPGVVSHGRMLLPSSPLEHIGALLKSLQGSQQDAAIQQQMADLLRQKSNTDTRANEWMMNQLRGWRERNAQPPQAPPVGSTGLSLGDFAGKLR